MIQKLQAMKSKKGFTLVELIVVIAIIAVLSAILVPTMMNWAKNAAIESAISQAKTVKSTLAAYETDATMNGGGFIASSSVFILEKTASAFTVYKKNSTDAKAVTGGVGDFYKDGGEATGTALLASVSDVPVGSAIILCFDASKKLSNVFYTADEDAIDYFTDTGNAQFPTITTFTGASAVWDADSNFTYKTSTIALIGGSPSLRA